LGRKSLIVTVFLIAATLQITAQEGASAFDFTENKGQWDKQVRFRGELAAGAFYLHNNGFTVVQHNGDDLYNFFQRHHIPEVPGKGGISRPDRGNNGKPGQPPAQPSTPPVIHSHAYRVQFIDANEHPQVVPEKQVQTATSYFIGDDPSKWAVNVPVYQALVYKNVYPNIDVRYYSEYGRLKYDIIVHPGGDPGMVAMRYEGADKLSIRKNELIIKTSVGELKEMYPYTYQFDMTSGKKEIDCFYEIRDKNIVRFKVANYTKTSTLVIDPTLVFCSFTGSAANQYGFTATPGPDGSLYSGGIVFGQGFPTTPGAFQTGHGGGSTPNNLGGIDMGIFKFTPNGQRAYATYLGGSGNDYPHSLICDGNGNLVVMGKTYSTDWVGPLARGAGGGGDIALAKLNATGTNLIGAMRIGGTGADGVNIANQIESRASQTSTMRFYGDDSRSEVILDNANFIYVAAQTQSTGNDAANRFPTTSGVFQPNPGGQQDGVVMKINPTCTDVIWSSFLGGSTDDAAFVMALNPVNNELYVGGATTSSNLPGAGGAYQASNQGGVADGFISRISNDGKSLIRTTYLGTDKFDAVYGLKFDRKGFPYAMGVTEGDWKVVNATYKVDNSRQFIIKLQPDLSTLVYTTVFGNGSAMPNISPVAFLVDRCENVYISGWGGWIDTGADPYHMGGIGNMPLTNDAIKKTTDNRDFYFIVIKRNAEGLLYGTYFGQNGGEGEHVDGGTSRYDDNGVIYQAICANCFGSRGTPITKSFPTTPGVWGPRNGTGDQGCNLAAVKIAFNFAGVASGPRAYFNGRPDTVGCVPFEVVLRDTVRNAKSYEWDFDGDGVNDLLTTSYETSYKFTAVGNYRVRLIAVDSSTCNQRDTAYLTIRVKNDPANIDFTSVKDGPCTSLTFRFTNTSTAGKPFQPNSFLWEFGDGTTDGPTGINSVLHDFKYPGTYPVRLTLLDTSFCNGGDWKEVKLGVVANVEARFETPAMGCAPYDAVFNNTSLGGHDYTWNFGDNTPESHEMSPVHRYDKVGTYTITLNVVDTNTCNKTSSTSFTITVRPKPTAEFSFAPLTPEVNKPTTFTNLSSPDVIESRWYWGDGDSLITKDRPTVDHQYNITDTYTTSLVVINKDGCTDTAHHDVSALIDPLLDVPNAFTPGRGNRSSIVKVMGYGIGQMTWRIYNRWGQKVFETTNRQTGWDGTFQGKLQPMDVYTYTLDVVFVDGKKLQRTGDITLIR